MKPETESEQVRKWESENGCQSLLPLSHFPTFPLSQGSEA